MKREKTGPGETKKEESYTYSKNKKDSIRREISTARYSMQMHGTDISYIY